MFKILEIFKRAKIDFSENLEIEDFKEAEQENINGILSQYNNPILIENSLTPDEIDDLKNKVLNFDFLGTIK